MKCSYHPGYQVAFPIDHPFPMSKYPLLMQRLLTDQIVSPADIQVPNPLDRNYPLDKMRSDLDVPLSNGIGDAEYLDILDRHLPLVMERARPELVFYVAGVDVAAGDRYGKLALTDEGVRRRERLVIETVRSCDVPLTIVLGGGYAPTRECTAELHTHVFRADRFALWMISVNVYKLRQRDLDKDFMFRVQVNETLVEQLLPSAQ